MIGHYLKVGLRGVAHHPLHSAVSVAVLALGTACFSAAYLFVSDLQNYDRQFANADRTRVIFQSLEVPLTGLSWPPTPWSSILLADQLKLDVPELEAVARYRDTGGGAFITVDGEPRTRRIAYAEPAFLDIFDFEAIDGDPRSALAMPRGAIITARAAESLFGTRDVIGKTLTVTDRATGDVVIAAVLADPPKASHLGDGLLALGFDVLLSWDLAATLAPLDPGQLRWSNMSVTTYALLPARGSLTTSELDRRLADLVQKHAVNPNQTIGFRARPVSEVSSSLLQGEFRGIQGRLWRFDVFGTLLLLAGTTLGVACVNFVNLATARAATRAREIGVRKAIGASASQVVMQDLVETGVTATLASLVALVAVSAFGGMLPEPWRFAFAVPWGEARLWAFAAALVVVVTLGAGLYPALMLARLRTASALRLGSLRAGPKALRTLLVGSQFAFSSFLLIAVVVALEQRGEVRDHLLGRFTDQYVLLEPETRGTATDPDVLAAEIAKGPGIRGVTAGRFSWQSLAGQIQYGRAQEAPRFLLEIVPVGHDYFAVMDLPAIAGRVFDRDRDDVRPNTADEERERATAPRLVLDRAAARAFGWSNPAEAVGETIFQDRGWLSHEIVGVVDSVPTALRNLQNAGTAYVLDPQNAITTIVRISTANVGASLAHIDAVLKSLAPDRPPRNRQFIDEAFESAYATFALVDRVLALLGGAAVAIAGIGLFGLASYILGRRTREIGLRKTQGATSNQIFRLLLWEFSKPVLIANLVAWPIAFVAAERYLGMFADRSALTLGPFLLALLSTLSVAGLAVGTRVFRASSVAPTEALRSE
jgi:putative ABC transport system permease protein